MKSVAIVIRKFVGFTGAVRTIQEHVRCFRRLGYTINIYAEKIDAEMVRQLGAIPHKIGFWPPIGRRGRPYFNWRVSRIIDSKDYGLVIGHGDIISQDVLVLHNCVHFAHESIYGEKLPQNDAVGRTHQAILYSGNFRLIIVYSNLMKNDISSRFNVSQSKIEVLYPGYYSEDFRIKAGSRERIRKELGVEPGEILIGLITSGSFEKRNIDLFLRAVGEVTKKVNVPIKAFVLGKRATAKGHQKLAAEAGLRTAILREPVTNIDEYYQALDIFALPAHIEEFGRVVLEAMIYGRPVVVSDRVGGAEILKGIGREGIFPAGNKDLLVDKIYRLASDSAYRFKMGEQNRRTVQNYTEANQMDKLVRILVERKLLTPLN